MTAALRLLDSPVLPIATIAGHQEFSTLSFTWVLRVFFLNGDKGTPTRKYSHHATFTKHPQKGHPYMLVSTKNWKLWSSLLFPRASLWRSAGDLYFLHLMMHGAHDAAIKAMCSLGIRWRLGLIEQGSLKDTFCPFEIWLFPPKYIARIPVELEYFAEEEHKGSQLQTMISLEGSA